MIFDTHAHYDDEAFNEDRELVLASLQEKGVGAVVNICASPASLKRITELTEKYSFMYGAVGIHPDHAGELTEEMFGEISRLADEEKIVAIGEIGLDYYWDKESDVQANQRVWFERQAYLAKELDQAGYTCLSEGETWTLAPFGKYYSCRE